MELRLQKFITSLETLSDIRNLDACNPVMLVLAHPTTGSPVMAIASTVEPNNLSVPTNAIWVVLDSHSPSYRKCLRLSSWAAPTEEYVSGLNVSWTVIDRYDDIFSVLQYRDSVAVVGPAGPVGPRGPAGPAGSSPVVDYSYILANLN